MTVREFVIAIPAWGQQYVDLATRYAVPALRRALGERPACFVVHTDAPEAFTAAFGDRLADVIFRPVPPGVGHAAQAAAHRQAITEAPAGSVVMLMNADVVISAESFTVAERFLTGKVKVISALGLRCLIGKSEPPIGAGAKTLLAWAWEHRHPINEDCVWGRGRTGMPTLLFFERKGSVTARCFHMHPIFIVKDRDRKFRGTIDDDLLAQYADDEIHMLCDQEAAFAELSPASKRFAHGESLSIESVVAFGAHRFTPAHIRSFGRPIRILGDDVVDEGIADAIVVGLARGAGLPKRRRPDVIVSIMRALKSFQLGDTGEVVARGERFTCAPAAGATYERRGMALMLHRSVKTRA